MTNDEFTLMMDALIEIKTGLNSLVSIAARRQSDPDYQYPLNRYQCFDWTAIGAEVIEADNDGATEVLWNGHIYTRRSPQNKYAPAIWFSRAVGKGEDGKTTYARLVTFKESEGADPLPRKISSRFQGQPQPATVGQGNGTISREQWLERKARQG